MALLIAGLLLCGCGERSNDPAFPEINPRGTNNDGVFTYKRAYSTIEDHAGYELFNFTESKNFFTKLYTPPSWEAQGQPFPILYLLHDFRGDENYYVARMVQIIADSLILEGDIKEFYIATVDVSTPYGGSWYNNNEFYGWFEDMITEEWIQFIEVELDPILKVLDSRDSRAIGGFGMGGYGALKLAAMRPDLYGSVSASNPAGKFDGEGNLRGLMSLVDSVFAEQPFDMGDPNAFMNDFDTSGLFTTKPYTQLFFSMAQAFSPHPLDEDDPDFLDSTTYLPFYGIDLPFDYNGNPYQNVWDKWLMADLDNIIPPAAGHFDSIAVYLEYSDEDQFYFGEQAQAVMSIFDQNGIIYSSDSYTGYPGYPANNMNFIYDRLVEILKFHSRNLQDM